MSLDLDLKLNLNLNLDLIVDLGLVPHPDPAAWTFDPKRHQRRGCLIPNGTSGIGSWIYTAASLKNLLLRPEARRAFSGPQRVLAPPGVFSGPQAVPISDLHSLGSPLDFPYPHVKYHRNPSTR
jgi:hypothetical protein